MIQVTRQKIISILSGLLPDIAFVLVALTAEYWFSFIGTAVNAIVLFFLYYIFIYLYRYMFIHQIGSRGLPLYVQMNVPLPKKIIFIHKMLFAVVFLFFPFFLYGLCVLLAQPILDFNSNPLLPAMMGIPIILSICYCNFIIYLNSEPHDESLADELEMNWFQGIVYHRPGPWYRKFLERFLIPFLSIIAMVSIARARTAWMNMEDSSEPWQLLIMTLGAFIPFRYLIMRIQGVHILSLLSLIITVVFIVLFYL